MAIRSHSLPRTLQITGKANRTDARHLGSLTLITKQTLLIARLEQAIFQMFIRFIFFVKPVVEKYAIVNI